ncbi:hypothetical protein [Mesobacillus zeae]|uniref:Abortive phage infection protein n=1 Tax=Mesobacillus zeae TaxID=1917180 RepID=A0A398BD29_9BACI|nr:hypothetical protein [Mesobacillus zeae]RID88129.1 hypothetical protein D1970_02940 [Mesobacillus zeae]
MDQEEIRTILDRLKNGELTEYYVTRDVFLLFREVLVNREDFKHFRGVAQRGGDVLYRYSDVERS